MRTRRSAGHPSPRFISGVWPFRDRNQKRIDQSGFTLVEVLIAMLILSVGLLGVTGMSRTIISANRFSRNMTTAVFLAQSKMEDLRRAAFSGVLTDANDSVEANLDESGAAGGIFTRTTDVTGGANQLTTLQVTITWTEANPRTISLTTLLRQ